MEIFAAEDKKKGLQGKWVGAPYLPYRQELPNDLIVMVDDMQRRMNELLYIIEYQRQTQEHTHSEQQHNQPGQQPEQAEGQQQQAVQPQTNAQHAENPKQALAGQEPQHQQQGHQPEAPSQPEKPEEGGEAFLYAGVTLEEWHQRERIVELTRKNRVKKAREEKILSLVSLLDELTQKSAKDEEAPVIKERRASLIQKIRDRISELEDAEAQEKQNWILDWILSGNMRDSEEEEDSEEDEEEDEDEEEEEKEKEIPQKKGEKETALEFGHPETLMGMGEKYTKASDGESFNFEEKFLERQGRTVLKERSSLEDESLHATEERNRGRGLDRSPQDHRGRGLDRSPRPPLVVGVGRGEGFALRRESEEEEEVYLEDAPYEAYFYFEDRLRARSGDGESFPDARSEGRERDRGRSQPKTGMREEEKRSPRIGLDMKSTRSLSEGSSLLKERARKENEEREKRGSRWNDDIEEMVVELTGEERRRGLGERSPRSPLNVGAGNGEGPLSAFGRGTVQTSGSGRFNGSCNAEEALKNSENGPWKEEEGNAWASEEEATEERRAWAASMNGMWAEEKHLTEEDKQGRWLQSGGRGGESSDVGDELVDSLESLSLNVNTNRQPRNGRAKERKRPQATPQKQEVLTDAMYEEFKQFFLDAMRDGSKNEIVRKWGIQFAQGLTQKQISELFQVRLRTGDLWVARAQHEGFLICVGRRFFYNKPNEAEAGPPAEVDEQVQAETSNKRKRTDSYINPAPAPDTEPPRKKRKPPPTAEEWKSAALDRLKANSGKEFTATAFRDISWAAEFKSGDKRQKLLNELGTIECSRNVDLASVSEGQIIQKTSSECTYYQFKG